MIGPGADQNRIDDEASLWVARLADGPLSSAETRALEAWKAADPRHAKTLALFSEGWQAAGELTHLRALADAQPSPIAMFGRNVRRQFARPAVWGAGIAAAAAALAVFAFLPPTGFSDPGERFETAVAEIRPVTLPDGSVVTLSADSTIEVRFSESERRVALVSGQAFFDVAPNPGRPFFVDAGLASVRVTGTKFDVHRQASGVAVAVLEGEVHVAGERSVREETSRVLRAGESVSVTRRSPLPFLASARLEPIASTPPDQVAEWRAGRLNFENARFADVAADLSRYYGPGVRVEGEAADFQVTAFFRQDEIEAFLDVVDQTLPVEVSRGAGGAYLVRARAHE